MRTSTASTRPCRAGVRPWALGLLGAALLAAPLHGEVVTDFVTATNPSNTSSFAGNILVSGSLLIGSNVNLATGGEITYVSGREIHTFRSNGTFVVSGASLTCDVLIVAGGGSGGGGVGGGGGGGGVIATSMVVAADTYSVTVGRGGSGVYNSRSNGLDSAFHGLTAIGGGGGGSYFTGSGLSGGSGGGHPGEGGTEGAGTAGQGYGGGDAGHAYPWGSGGGGGASQAGVNGTPSQSGNGGQGLTNAYSGSAQVYGSGGSGGSGIVIVSLPGTPTYVGASLTYSNGTVFLDHPVSAPGFLTIGPYGDVSMGSYTNRAP